MEVHSLAKFVYIIPCLQLITSSLMATMGLSELDEALLSCITESAVFVVDWETKKILGMNSTSKTLTDRGRELLIAASCPPIRDARVDVDCLDQQVWLVDSNVVSGKLLIKARPAAQVDADVPDSLDLASTSVVSLDKASVETSSDRMMTSLNAALFDAIIYLDADFRIKGDYARFASLLSLQPGLLLDGMLFKELIATNQDRERFEMYVERPLSTRDSKVVVSPSATSTSGSTASSSGASVALMLEVVFGMDPQRLVNFRIFVTSTFGEVPEYLVGLQSTGQDASQVAGANRQWELKPTVPTPETEGYMAVLHKNEQAPSVMQETCALFDEAERESTLFRHPLSISNRDQLTPQNRRLKAPPHVSLVTMFYRVMNKDLVVMACEADVDDGADLWITPIYKVTDLDAVMEDLVKLLPHGLQEEFVLAEIKADLFKCCSLLQHSTVGNLDVLSFAKGYAPTSSAHHFCATVRFMLGKLSLCEESDIIPFLDQWTDGYESLNVFCSSMRAQIALTVISCAIAHPETFSSNSETAKLRNMFANMISKTDSFGVTDQVRLPAVYSACILWASLQRDRGRIAEAVQILEGAAKDMELYSLRHPGSLIIHQLISIVCFDLAAAAIEVKISRKRRNG